MARQCQYEKDKCENETQPNSDFCEAHEKEGYGARAISNIRFRFGSPDEVGKRSLRLARGDALLLYRAIETGAIALSKTLPKRQFEALKQVCARFRSEFKIKA